MFIGQIERIFLGIAVARIIHVSTTVSHGHSLTAKVSISDRGQETPIRSFSHGGGGLHQSWVTKRRSVKPEQMTARVPLHPRENTDEKFVGGNNETRLAFDTSAGDTMPGREKQCESGSIDRRIETLLGIHAMV